MAQYEITAPDGRKFRITAPDDATQEQVLAYAKENFAKAERGQASQADVRKSEPLEPEPPSTFDKVKGKLRSATAMTPPGVLARGVGAAGELFDRTAYDLGGAVTDQASKVLPPEAAAAAGFAANVGMQAVPALLGGQAAKVVASPAMEAGARRLMHSALKPSSKDIISGDAAKAIDTLLQEGANVSTAGATKLRTLINQLSKEVAEKIAASPSATVDKSRVAREVFGTLKKFREQVNKRSDVKQVLASWKEFTEDYASKIPVAEAQKIKQGTYRNLADKYAKGGLPAIENEASTQTQMAMARGLRKGIEDAVPGVGELNARESAIINALELAEKRAGIAGNRDIGGIAWLANNPAVAAAMMADRSSAFKSWLANKLNKYRNVAPQAAGSGITATYEASTQNQ